MTEEQYKERMTNENYKAIEITTKDSGEDYVFISYKSDDWETVIAKVAYTLQKKYGLNIYFDKSFNTNNNVWTEQFPANMESPHCKAVLVFESNAYFKSYATLLELLYSQTNRCTLAPRESRKPVIPIVLEKIDQNMLGNDDGTTGLGDEEHNIYAGTEKELFDKTYNQIYKKYVRWCSDKGRDDAIDGLYDSNSEKKLEVRHCARIMKSIIEMAGSSENRFMDNDEFFSDLKGTIESVAPTVFGKKIKEEISSEGKNFVKKWIEKYKSDREYWNPDFEELAKDEDYEFLENDSRKYEEAFNDYYEFQNIHWNSDCYDSGLVWGFEEFAKDFYGLLCSDVEKWTYDKLREFDAKASEGFLNDKIDMSDIESYDYEDESPILSDVTYVLTKLAEKSGHPNYDEVAMDEMQSKFRAVETLGRVATYRDVLECACMILNSLGYDVGNLNKVFD